MCTRKYNKAGEKTEREMCEPGGGVRVYINKNNEKKKRSHNATRKHATSSWEKKKEKKSH